MYKLIDIRTGRVIATYETHADAWRAMLARPWSAIQY